MMVKAKTMDLISSVAEGVNNGMSAEEYATRLIELASKAKTQPVMIGKKAIKTESALWV